MKKKIVFREFNLTLYCDGDIDMDGFEKFFTKKIRVQIIQLLKQAGYKLINKCQRYRR